MGNLNFPRTRRIGKKQITASLRVCLLDESHEGLMKMKKELKEVHLNFETTGAYHK